MSESEVIGQQLLLHCYAITEKNSGLASDNTFSDIDRIYTFSIPPCYRVVTFQPSCSDKSRNIIICDGLSVILGPG